MEFDVNLDQFTHFSLDTSIQSNRFINIADRPSLPSSTSTMENQDCGAFLTETMDSSQHLVAIPPQNVLKVTIPYRRRSAEEFSSVLQSNPSDSEQLDVSIGLSSSESLTSFEPMWPSVELSGSENNDCVEPNRPVIENYENLNGGDSFNAEELLCEQTSVSSDKIEGIRKRKSRDGIRTRGFPKKRKTPEAVKNSVCGSNLHPHDSVCMTSNVDDRNVLDTDDSRQDQNDLNDEMSDSERPREASLTDNDGPAKKKFKKKYLRPCHVRSLKQLEQKLTMCEVADCCKHKYHCPLCPTIVFYPAVLRKVRGHLQRHWSSRIDYNGLWIVRCSQPCKPCAEVSHYHCPCCHYVTDRRSYLTKHLNKHNDDDQPGQKKRSQRKVDMEEDTEVSNIELDVDEFERMLDVSHTENSLTDDVIPTAPAPPGVSTPAPPPYIHETKVSTITTTTDQVHQTDFSSPKSPPGLVTIGPTAAPPTVGSHNNSSVVDQNTDKQTDASDKKTSKSLSKTCGYCDQVLASFKEYVTHLRQVHNTRSGPREKTECDICGLILYKKHLKAHISAIHKLLKPYSCSICKKKFAQKSYVKHHEKTHQRIEEKFECSVCGKVYKNNFRLREHMNRHTRRRPYKCTVCEKCFHSRSAAARHLYDHR